MHLFRSTIALVGQLGLGVLMLGAMSGPVRNGAGVPPPAPLARTTAAQPARDWTFQIDEYTLSHDLNAWAAGQPLLQTPLGNVRLQDIAAEIRDDQLRLHATADTGWGEQPVSAVVSVSTNAGRARVRVQQAQVGRFELPEVVRGQLEQQVQNQLDQSLAASQLMVSTVKLGEGALVVSGSHL